SSARIRSLSCSPWLVCMLTRFSPRQGSAYAGAPGSDHFLGALGPDDDFAGLGHAPGDAEDFLLRRFHVADAHRAEVLQVVAQQLAGTLGHVLEDLFLDVLVRALERSEEHTSELQSRENLVCRLLLEKKNRTNQLT